jgi:transcriptional regulator with XRE-family HTH domain
MLTFGQRIKEARKLKGWTLEKTAKAVRSHKGYISGIENGKVKAPSPKIIPLLCSKLELPLTEMMALAWWEKRPKAVTTIAAHELLSKIREEEAKAKSDESQVLPPALPAKEAV